MNGSSWKDTGALLARWALGAVFIYTGTIKTLHPVEFLKLLRQYDLVQTPWMLNSIAALLPWFEIVCGVLLIAGIAVRGSSLLLLAMLIPFTIVVFRRALAYESALAIPFCAVKFDCGCGTGEVFICRKLLENGILIFLSCWLVLGKDGRFNLRHTLFRT